MDTDIHEEIKYLLETFPAELPTHPDPDTFAKYIADLKTWAGNAKAELTRVEANHPQITAEYLLDAMNKSFVSGYDSAQVEIERLHVENTDLRGQVDALEVDVNFLENQIDGFDGFVDNRGELVDLWDGWDL